MRKAVHILSLSLLLVGTIPLTATAHLCKMPMKVEPTEMSCCGTTDRAVAGEVALRPAQAQCCAATVIQKDRVQDMDYVASQAGTLSLHSFISIPGLVSFSSITTEFPQIVFPPPAGDNIPVRSSSLRI